MASITFVYKLNKLYTAITVELCAHEEQYSVYCCLNEN